MDLVCSTFMNGFTANLRMHISLVNEIKLLYYHFKRTIIICTIMPKSAQIPRFQCSNVRKQFDGESVKIRRKAPNYAGAFYALRLCRSAISSHSPIKIYGVWMLISGDKLNSFSRHFSRLLHRDFHFALISCHFNNLMQIRNDSSLEFRDECWAWNEQTIKDYMKYISYASVYAGWASSKCI